MAVSLVGSFEINDNAYATPFFENGHFTSNGIEWCQENLQLYEILGKSFLSITNILWNQEFAPVSMKIHYGVMMGQIEPKN